MDHCPLIFFGAKNLGGTMFMAKKLMTEMDYQGYTCTTVVGEE